MYSINEIRHVHLEISSRCNAACPLCPRNFYGFPYNDGYVEHDMTLAEAQKIFPIEFVQQLKTVYINGNFGDMVMNPETTDIVRYFVTNNSQLKVTLSTNGGARDRDFWQKLAMLGAIVVFCIDGLEDTHSLYRQNTLYSTVIKNAQTFIETGGHAEWKMIKFEHNRHQFAQAEHLSQQMGFKRFIAVDDGRNQGPVYNKNKELVHVMGQPKTVEFEVLFRSRTTDQVLLEDIVNEQEVKPITCPVKESKSMYVSSTGDVYPCCFTGFNPKNYGHGNYHQAVNEQLRPLISNNNALKHSLAECIEWFNLVEKTWEIPEFEKGRLVICNDVCGKN